MATGATIWKGRGGGGVVVKRYGDAEGIEETDR